MEPWPDARRARRTQTRYLLEAPLRRPGLALLPVAVLLPAALALALALAPRYRASALLVAEWSAADDAAVEGRGIDPGERRREAVRRLLLEPAAIERLARHAGPGAGGPKGPLAEERVRASLRVEAEGSRAFRIECVQEDAARAALVANFLARELVERSQREHDAQRGTAGPGGLEVRLGEAGRRLDAARAAVVRARATPFAAAPSPAAPAPTALAPSAPSATVPPQAAPALAAQSPAPEQQLRELARDYEEAQQHYDALFAEWQVTETAARLGRGPLARFELVRPAGVPRTPDAGGRWLWVLATGAAGLLLGLGAAVVAELRDRTVKGPADLADVLPAPLLATIPLVRTGRLRRARG